MSKNNNDARCSIIWPKNIHIFCKESTSGECSDCGPLSYDTMQFSRQIPITLQDVGIHLQDYTVS